ncbi:hypothetical protein [Cellvibrio sp. PSBB023]|uniref:hypothetical protein n=1 Tax=Cellvibrio sp. PSBB023 TaxID=1945512 RepID=UPI00098FD570|nr:hypothetical protein [Cellvibrio sp. PSBB023]AQT59298.1 hypothetical protein B0D95_03715 [Cellvibrio sp. PSBB023]
MLKLLLPILFPSWRFFSSIGPSPRIDVAFVTEKNAEPQTWLPFRPLPETVGFAAGVRRLFHNPAWNEQLYINTCAEHLFEEPSDFYAQEIGVRLVAAASNKEIIVDDTSRYLVFRIRTIEFDAGQVSDEVVFISQPFLLQAAGGR